MLRKANILSLMFHEATKKEDFNDKTVTLHSRKKFREKNNKELITLWFVVWEMEIKQRNTIFCPVNFEKFCRNQLLHFCFLEIKIEFNFAFSSKDCKIRKKLFPTKISFLDECS